MKRLLLKALLFCIPFALAGQDGALDTSFDGDGILEGNGVGYDNVMLLPGLGLFAYPNGKLLIGMTAGSTSAGVQNGFAFTRLQQNSVSDVTFSDDGIVVGYIEALLTDFEVASNGNIIGLGLGPNATRVLMRFNGAGDVLLPSSVEANGGADMRLLEIQPDGKLVTAGSVGSGTNQHFFVGRLNNDFSIDILFASGGGTIIEFDGPGVARDLELTENGLIVVAGDFAGGQDRNVGVAVLTPTGAPVFGFSNDGKQSLDLSGDDFVTALTVQPDGKYLIAGQNVNLSGRDIFLARFNPDGTLDNSFGNQGKAVVDVSGKEDWPADMVLQTDGKILVSSSACFNNAGCDFLLARFNADGTLDPSFGNGGTVVSDLTGLEDRAYAMGLDPSGAVIVAGGSTIEPGFSTGNYVVAKYLTDLSVSLREPENQLGPVLVYPNPIVETAVVECASTTAGRYILQLRDAEGQLIRSWDEGWHPAGTAQFSLQFGKKQPAGWYTLEIANGQQRQVVRIMLK